MDIQPKLLRALQEGGFERLGGEKPVRVDVRIIAATHSKLQNAGKAGTFPEDLYYRLAVFPIELPPLRSRSSDILLLANYFLRRVRDRSGRHILTFSPKALDKLQGYDWPGNIRELKNVIERASILAVDGVIQPDHITGLRSKVPEVDMQCEEGDVENCRSIDIWRQSLDDAMAEHIRPALQVCNGKIYGPDGAAAFLALKPSTLQSRMKKLGITRK